MLLATFALCSKLNPNFGVIEEYGIGKVVVELRIT